MRVLSSLTAPAASGLAAGQTLLLALLPHGGQHASRRNAWSGMAADAQRARARREAAVALDLAVATTQARGHVGGRLPRTGSR